MMGDPKHDTLGRKRATPANEQEKDVEGSSMFPHPGVVQDLGRVREAELQRDLRARAQEFEAQQARKNEALQARQRELDAKEAEAQRQPGPLNIARTPGT
jgi:hypothetical protein